MRIRFLLLIVTHLAALGGGFAAGIYALPILIAPPSPDADVIAEAAASSDYTGTFSRDRTDSDALHWGEGVVSLSNDNISFEGELAPGPDYRLYLSPTFIETEAEFNELKATMFQVGPVRTFDNFVVPVPAGINLEDYGAVIIWCESFGQFITSASYSSVTSAGG